MLPTIRSRRKPSAATSTKLEKEGYATKTYGGAILGNSTKTDLSHAIRSKTNVEFKNQIADLVCQMVDDGDHLMIDDSSTALFCAKKLRDKKNLTIITNSVELVVELANVETWSILLTGGRLKAESLALVGSPVRKISQQLSCGQGLRLLQGSRPRSGRH